MPRVLIIAYYFPPIGGIGAIRMARFASFLPEHGWEPTVIAPLATPHAPDPSLRFAESQVVRSRSIELSQLGRMGRSGQGPSTAPEHGLSIRGALRRSAHRYLFYPDPQVGWYPGAVAAAVRTLRSKRFDVIYSSSNPVTAHLVARTLARRTGLPWVAEYRDPWCDRLAAGQPYLRRAQALERGIARDATKVVMPTPTWAAYYGARWGTDIAVLPNGHDPDLPERRLPEYPTLVHVGSYYPGEQDMTTLWQALAQLSKSDPKGVPRVRFVGHMPPQLREEIASFGLGGVLESTGFLSHDSTMRELMSASMLIASGIAGDDPARRGCVPAKLFEYLASDLPVLYIADSRTDAAQLLTGQPGVHVVTPGDVDGALAALRAGLTGVADARTVGHLGRDVRAKELARLLEHARSTRIS